MDSAVVIPDLTAQLVAPPDGTLSRVLHRSDSLRLVGFAFAEGQEFTEHSSALEVVIQVVRGRLALRLGDAEPVELGPTGWVRMPPRLPHSVRALEPTVMLLTMLAAPAHPGGAGT
jgi:quercetin dioxygenase-like cupin family protein